MSSVPSSATYRYDSIRRYANLPTTRQLSHCQTGKKLLWNCTIKLS